MEINWNEQFKKMIVGTAENLLVAGIVLMIAYMMIAVVTA